MCSGKAELAKKNAHLQAKVDPFKLFEALKFLKKCGNKHYSESMNLEDYKKRCEYEDPDGNNLLFCQDKAETTSDSTLKSSFFPDDASEPILELEIFLDIQRHENSEQEYREKDSIRKYQIDYDESICMVEKYPEAMQVDGVIGQSECEANSAGEEKNQLFVIAPGEGKIPINLTFCKDWDAKAFPMLHPDGKNNLTEERRKLADVDYFKQRLFNKDSRWRDHPHWVFAAAVYKEKKDFQRNIDLAYRKGKKDTRNGRTVYKLSDPYSVFQNVANTPAYHKKGKMEMMARLDNQGPFHVFFTLSCADTRWPEYVISLLVEKGFEVRCNHIGPETET